MDSFHHLSQSLVFEDSIRHDILIRLLDQLFGQHNQIIINSECENEKNQQFIKDQFKTLQTYFFIPKRVVYTQKSVRQTVKHMIDFLNNQYQFKKPIQFNPKRETIREGERTCAVNYTILDLV